MLRERVTKSMLPCVVLLALPLFSVSVAAQNDQVNGQTVKVVDYMVATVNGSLVTYSDLVWQLALQPNTLLDNPRREDLQRALETIIEQRLVFQDAEKLPHIHATDKEIEVAIADLLRMFPSQEEFRQRMARTGLTAERLREIVGERVEIEKYLDFRFRSFTVVAAKEINEYYRDTYVPQFRKRLPGAVVPKITDVRAQIEKQLIELRVGSDLQKYIDERRERAEIVILQQP
ncbi:MAG TPA: SurA N-terminal domain-containing protein [Pyrinomonadaceae bacterium]